MAKAKRCLIVERHPWETGAHKHQLQFPLKIADQFFGSGLKDRTITVNMILSKGAAPLVVQMTISRQYKKSATRRTNKVRQMGKLPSSFIFFQETSQPDVYTVWYQEDKAIVAARFPGWSQGRSNQHRRGRLAIIVSGPVPRPVVRL